MPKTDLERLNAKHPIYERMAPKWHLWGRTMSGDFQAVDLPRGEIENETLYAQRSNLTEWIPEAPKIVKRILSAIYKEPPNRETDFASTKSKIEKLASALTRLIFRKPPEEDVERLVQAIIAEDADLYSQGMDAFMRTVAAKGVMTYGVGHVLVDKPSVDNPGGATLTREDEIRLGIERPFMRFYGPLSLWNWAVDEQGKLLWAVLHEDDYETTDRGRTQHKIERFREFTRTDMWVWQRIVESDTNTDGENTSDTLEQVKHVEHNLGRVPIATIYGLGVETPMVGDSFIKLIARADVRKLQIESDNGWALYLHNHPFLKILTTRDLGEVGIGTNAYLKLNPDQREDAEYVQPPDSVFKSNADAIDHYTTEAHKQGGLDPLGTHIDQPSNISGISRAWSFMTSEGPTLASLADQLEAGERDVFELVVRWLTPSRRKAALETNARYSWVRITYPDNFDLAEISALESMTPAVIQSRSQAGWKAFMKRLLGIAVGDVDPDIRMLIGKEIDDAKPPWERPGFEGKDAYDPVSQVPSQRQAANEDAGVEQGTQEV